MSAPRLQHVPGTLVNEGGIPRHAVGKIKIRERHTLVDVPAHFAGRVLSRASAQPAGSRGPHLIRRWIWQD